MTPTQDLHSLSERAAIDRAVLSFIVPVRNDARHLEKCLASIRADVGDFPIDVVVIDNGSTDESEKVAREGGAQVVRFAGASVSRLRNAGVAVSSGSLVAFVDADHEIAPGWVAAALAQCADPSVGAAGAPYHAPPDGTWVQRAYDRFRAHAQRPAAARWLGSGNLVVKRDTFRAIGGFDESLIACEDVDLCSRIRRAGYRIVNDPALVSIHHGDPETLRALFVSELWRGRDNLRVTITSDRSWQSVASCATAVLNLVSLASIGAGLLLLSPRLAGAGVATIVGLAAARSVLMLRPTRVSAAIAAQVLIVTLVYHVGRGIALVWPARHRNASAPNLQAVRDL